MSDFESGAFNRALPPLRTGVPLLSLSLLAQFPCPAQECRQLNRFLPQSSSPSGFFLHRQGRKPKTPRREAPLRFPSLPVKARSPQWFEHAEGTFARRTHKTSSSRGRKTQEMKRSLAYRFIRFYSETRVGVSRRHSTQVDATIRERRPCTRLAGPQELWFRSIPLRPGTSDAESSGGSLPQWRRRGTLR